MLFCLFTAVCCIKIKSAEGIPCVLIRRHTLAGFQTPGATDRHTHPRLALKLIAS